MRTVFTVNLGKFVLLAALTPPVIAGIAHRATLLGEGFDTAAIVATTASLGSLSAVIGALLAGFLADVSSAQRMSRWGWTALGATVGSVGLVVLSTGGTRTLLTLGWVLAQFGYSGAMAMLRVLLADALPQHRRRGAAISVLGSYAVLLVPISFLILFPTRIWETTFGLALLGVAIPTVVFLILRKQPGTSARTAAEGLKDEPMREETALLPRVWVLVIQFAANIVMAVYLSYHPLELAQRAGTSIPIQSTIVVATCAVIGILLTTSVLMWKPALLTNSSRIIVIAGYMLAASFIVRVGFDPLEAVAFAALLSGAAVGLNSSALFASALDHARDKHGGKVMGMYSAAGAAGQVVGPILALGLLWMLPHPRLLAEVAADYRMVFVAFAVLPFTWSTAVLLAMFVRPRSKPHQRSHDVAKAVSPGRSTPLQQESTKN